MRAPFALWFAILFLALLSACSDTGSGPEPNWKTYDLPAAKISIPPEFEYHPSQASGGVMNTNPYWLGTIDGKAYRVEALIHEAAVPGYMEHYPGLFSGYQEENLLLSGTPARMFRGFGAVHAYNSMLTYLMGVSVTFFGSADPCVVVVTVPGEDDYWLARRILTTLRPG